MHFGEISAHEWCRFGDSGYGCSRQLRVLKMEAGCSSSDRTGRQTIGWHNLCLAAVYLSSHDCREARLLPFWSCIGFERQQLEVPTVLVQRHVRCHLAEGSRPLCGSTPSPVGPVQPALATHNSHPSGFFKCSKKPTWSGYCSHRELGRVSERDRVCFRVRKGCL